MSQPFRRTAQYCSSLWEQIKILYHPDHIAIISDTSLQTLSSAIVGGGGGTARVFINGKVSLCYQSLEPEEMTRNQLIRWGYREEETLALLTAAKLTHASIAEENGDGFRLIACTTSGTGNAARAGQVERTYSAYQLGTINTFVLIDGCMTAAAMVNAVMTATEAKACALQDLDIRCKNGRQATGTTSDAFVLAVSQREGAPIHPFAGSATTIGDAIARNVYQTVQESVATQGEE